MAAGPLELRWMSASAQCLALAACPSHHRASALHQAYRGACIDALDGGRAVHARQARRGMFYCSFRRAVKEGQMSLLDLPGERGAASPKHSGVRYHCPRLETKGAGRGGHSRLGLSSRRCKLAFSPIPREQAQLMLQRAQFEISTFPRARPATSRARRSTGSFERALLAVCLSGVLMSVFWVSNRSSVFCRRVDEGNVDTI